MAIEEIFLYIDTMLRKNYLDFEDPFACIDEICTPTISKSCGWILIKLSIQINTVSLVKI